MRYILFLLSFAIILGIANTIHIHLGYLVVGLGFSIAYFYGEGNAH